jgi:hypothetical protein
VEDQASVWLKKPMERIVGYYTGYDLYDDFENNTKVQGLGPRSDVCLRSSHGTERESSVKQWRHLSTTIGNPQTGNADGPLSKPRVMFT